MNERRTLDNSVDRTGCDALDGFAKEIQQCRRHAARGHRANLFAMTRTNHAEIGLAQPHSRFEHHVENRREIARRGVDNLYDVGYRPLLLAGLVALGKAFGKLGGALIEFASEISDDLPWISG